MVCWPFMTGLTPNARFQERYESMAVFTPCRIHLKRPSGRPPRGDSFDLQGSWLGCCADDDFARPSDSGREYTDGCSAYLASSISVRGSTRSITLKPLDYKVFQPGVDPNPSVDGKTVNARVDRARSKAHKPKPNHPWRTLPATEGGFRQLPGS
jgi:hypothetical protein